MAFRHAVPAETDVDRLRRWYAGEDLPDGRHDGPRAGLVGRRALVRRCRRAPTSSTRRSRRSVASGQVHAARARARRPDAAAKEAAWRLLVEPSSTPAYALYATGEGFWDAGQDDLTAPYVARYFAEIGATATFREGWALGQVATQAFPRTAATPEAVALAEDALGGSLAAQVHRAVTDGTDRLHRAVESLRRWG